MEQNKIAHCKNCGAPALMEICRYCKQPSGIDENSVELEYQVIDCEELNYGFEIYYIMISILTFIIVPGFSMATAYKDNEVLFKGIIITTSVLVLLWLIIIAFPLSKYIYLRYFGKEIEAVVHGYLNDVYKISGKPIQIIKLLVQTYDGPKYILYQSGRVDRLYQLNEKIKLKAHKNRFLIVD